MASLTFPSPNMTEGVQGILTFGNDVTNNLFSSSLLLMMFLIIFLSLKGLGFRTEQCFASASFSTATLSYMFLLLPGFISPEIIVATTLISGISVFFLYKMDRN